MLCKFYSFTRENLLEWKMAIQVEQAGISSNICNISQKSPKIGIYNLGLPKSITTVDLLETSLVLRLPKGTNILQEIVLASYIQVLKVGLHLVIDIVLKASSNY